MPRTKPLPGERANDPIVLALPKGRILKEVMPLLHHAGIEPEPVPDEPASEAEQGAAQAEPTER